MPHVWVSSCRWKAGPSTQPDTLWGDWSSLSRSGVWWAPCPWLCIYLSRLNTGCLWQPLTVPALSVKGRWLVRLISTAEAVLILHMQLGCETWNTLELGWLLLCSGACPGVSGTDRALPPSHLQ